MIPSPDNLPLAVVVLAENDDALRFIAMLGMQDKVPDPTTLALTAIAVVYMAHPTHWIVIYRFEGFDLPSDNGYEVHCLPKDWYAREQVDEIIRDLIRDDHGRVQFDSRLSPFN